MRILMLCYEFPPVGGGASRVVKGLTSQLTDSGHAVDLVTTRFNGDKSFEQFGDFRIWRVRCWRRLADRSTAIELATYIFMAFFVVFRLARTNRYDVCHVHFLLPDGVIAWLLKLCLGLRFIVTAHGSDVPGYNPDRFLAVYVLELRVRHSADVRLATPINDLPISQTDHPRGVTLHQV